MTRVLAIDPGSMLGWATDATGRLEWGTEDFRIKSGESSGNRWRRFGEWFSDFAGLTPIVQCPPDAKEEDVRRITNSMRDNRSGVVIPKGYSIIQKRKVDLVVYEHTTFIPKFQAGQRAEIAGAFKSRFEEHCERHGIALQPVAVQTLKAFAIPKVKRKKGDPKMDRSKAAMISAARNKLGSLGDDRGPGRCGPGGFETYPLTEHEADALWAYWWAKENCG